MVNGVIKGAANSGVVRPSPSLRTYRRRIRRELLAASGDGGAGPPDAVWTDDLVEEIGGNDSPTAEAYASLAVAIGDLHASTFFENFTEEGVLDSFCEALWVLKDSDLGNLSLQAARILHEITTTVSMF